MTTANRKWLTRLLDQLEDIADLHPWLGLGIVISSDEKEPVEDGVPGNGLTDDEWLHVGLKLFDDANATRPESAFSKLGEDDRDARPRHGNRGIFIPGRTFWVEPLPPRTACVFWFGNKDGVAKITEWTTKAATLMGRHPEVMGDITDGRLKSFSVKDVDVQPVYAKGVHLELLRTLCEAILDFDPNSAVVRKRQVSGYKVLEVPRAARSMAAILRKLADIIPEEPGCKYDFSSKVWTISGHMPSGVRFSITWDTTTNIVTRKGHIIKKPLTDVQAQYLQAILEARGEFRSMGMIFGTKAASKLNTNRILKTLPESLQRVIEPIRGKGARLRTELWQ
jgi:hypothetical protein